MPATIARAAGPITPDLRPMRNFPPPTDCRKSAGILAQTYVCSVHYSHTETREAMVYIAMIHLMLKRLCPCHNT